MKQVIKRNGKKVKFDKCTLIKTPLSYVEEKIPKNGNVKGLLCEYIDKDQFNKMTMFYLSNLLEDHNGQLQCQNFKSSLENKSWELISQL